MGLEKVIEEVLSSGRRRRDEILLEGEEDYQRAVQASRDEVEEFRRQREGEHHDRVERMRNQELQTAELEVRRLELSMRRDVLDRVQEMAEERLRQLDRPRNEAMLSALLAGKEGQGARVYSSAKDEAMVRSISHLTYGGHIDCIGGVVIESADGSVREDLTYDTLLRERGEELLPVIADILFSEGGPR